MQLDEFIEQTLSQIARGVKAAQGQIAEFGGSVNPVMGTEDYPRNEPRLVSFDVAVTVLDESKGGASGRLAVLPFRVSAEGATVSANTTVSRVQFSIPVQVPTMKAAGRPSPTLQQGRVMRSS